MSPPIDRLAARLAKRWVGVYTRLGREGDRRDRLQLMLTHIDELERDDEFKPGRRAVRIVRHSALGIPADVRWLVREHLGAGAEPPSMSASSLTTTQRRAAMSGPDRRGRAERPRGPGVAYAVLSVALLCLVATVALTSRQAAPPTIAEFAPQAVEQISDSSGDAAGSRGAGSAETSESVEQRGAGDAAQQTIDVARVRQCVGDPPRQIEDPQSPPCVPYWSGDNGGATYKGVTRDEVRIAVPWIWAPALDRFFNARFQFYGRKLRFIDSNADFAGCTQEAQEAAAVAADEQRRVFASLEGPCGGSQYHVALARRRLVAVAPAPEFTESFMRARAPYMWTYPMAQDGMQAMFADWACARLAGGPARYAKGPEALRRRVFGIFSGTFVAADPPIETTWLREGLAGCGERSGATIETTASGDAYTADASNQATFQNAILQMREAGVTTIFCICLTYRWLQLGAAATSNGYFPEWLIGSYWLNDENFFVRATGPPEQRGQAMGLTSQPHQVKLAYSPAFWAESEGDPAAAAAGRPTSDHARTVNYTYRQRLLLASGIQMAGPHLTPETFERGLHRTVFPNPDHALKPGRVGFANGDHSMTEDVAEYWWSNTDRGPDSDDAGTICYVDNGERRTLGSFPSGDEPFFQAPCYSGA